MKSNRAEKLADKLHQLQTELKIVRKELHTCKQKNRDMEKTRTRHKVKLKAQEEVIKRQNEALKKKP